MLKRGCTEGKDPTEVVEFYVSLHRFLFQDPEFHSEQFQDLTDHEKAEYLRAISMFYISGETKLFHDESIEIPSDLLQQERNQSERPSR